MEYSPFAERMTEIHPQINLAWNNVFRITEAVKVSLFVCVGGEGQREVRADQVIG